MRITSYHFWNVTISTIYFHDNNVWAGLGKLCRIRNISTRFSSKFSYSCTTGLYVIFKLKCASTRSTYCDDNNELQSEEPFSFKISCTLLSNSILFASSVEYCSFVCIICLRNLSSLSAANASSVVASEEHAYVGHRKRNLPQTIFGRRESFLVFSRMLAWFDPDSLLD